MDLVLSTTAMGYVAVIMVLTSLSKTYIDSKYSPLVALVLSIAASVFLIPAPDLTHSILQGVLMALSGAGLYSGGKTLGNAVSSNA